MSLKKCLASCRVGLVHKTSGWGTFVVRIDIHYRDRHKQEIRHRLVFEHAKPKVFLSYPASETDSEVVQNLRQQAEEFGWEVSSADMIDRGEDWVSSLDKQIDDAALFLMIGGDTPSRLVMEEIAAAKQFGKKRLVFHKANLYEGMTDVTVTNSDELINDFKAIDFETEGVKQ